MRVEFTDESIGIISDSGELEYAYWIKDEWKEDPEVVFSIANAIVRALTNPEEFKAVCAQHGRPYRR